MKTPMRHGIAVLLVLLLCASVFLNEQLRRPTEAPPRARPHPPILQGYSGIIDHKETCSQVNPDVTAAVCIDFHLFTKPGENNQCEYLGVKPLQVKQT
ncbi:hypothetical protein JOQ06_001709 [Pogonophryne albipinna]|uniref:Uncharacterized protein n=1 Tax=Pogonophryne albipinna TaxID=1090488 RepID=A0AAD6B394_9TELE|nr:hypothetical protein JOQ06_001709 [Pogonophryne albipinna]